MKIKIKSKKGEFVFTTVTIIIIALFAIGLLFGGLTAFKIGQITNSIPAPFWIILIILLILLIRGGKK
jgi:hypothetical protein